MQGIFGHAEVIKGLTEEQCRNRLQLLMDTVQYSVNRLDADQSQPQVAGDLAVALAFCKSSNT